MKNSDKREKITMAGSILSFVIFALLLRSSNISVGSIVNIQNSLLKSMIIETAGQNTISAFFTLLNPFVMVFASLIFLVLSFAFASSWGYFDSNKRTASTIGIICAGVAVVLFPTIFGALFAISVFLAFSYVIPMSNTYGKEFKKWIMFRVGSHSIGKALLIVNIFIALGIFISVYSSLTIYQTNFKNDMIDTLTEVTIRSAPVQSTFIGNSAVRASIEQSIQGSALFESYFRWLPFSSAFGIWMFLEFLRNLVLSHIGGGFTSAIIKFYSGKK